MAKSKSPNPPFDCPFYSDDGLGNENCKAEGCECYDPSGLHCHYPFSYMLEDNDEEEI